MKLSKLEKGNKYKVTDNYGVVWATGLTKKQAGAKSKKLRSRSYHYNIMSRKD